MAITHVATTSWCCNTILVATRIMRGNTLSCNTHSSLLVHHLLRHGQLAITRSSNAYDVALVVVATPTTVAKSYVATSRCCKSKTHFATLHKVLSKALSMQALATPPNEKKLLFLLLQLFKAYCNTFRALK
jgi:hypothetical protein